MSALDAVALRKLSRTELLRVLDEFKSERDAAKRDAMRAFDERNIALARAEAAEAECARLRQEAAQAYEAAAKVCEHRASWSVLTTRLANAERNALLAAADNIRKLAIAEGKHEA